MFKHNLKLNDTFLVTVEILSANAIIVSANINSVIYRGALIQCSTSVPCSFKSNKISDNCFSSKRLNVTESKKSICLKNFKSDYNLRRTNHKIIKAKQIVCKSELKEATDDHINITKSLSIKLKKQNGIYKNVEDLTNMKRKLTETDNEQPRNVIKIKKIKLQSDEYHYSISTDDGPPPMLAHPDPLPFCFSESNYPEAIIEDDIKPPQLCAAPIPIRSLVSPEPDKMTPPLSESVTTPSVTSPCNGSISKLKIVKNSCNSYVIKTTDNGNTNTAICRGQHTRYNCKQFRKNDIIWAKLAGYSIWPAKVLDADDHSDHVLVLWLGNGQQTSRLHKRKLWDFGAHFHEKFNRKAAAKGCHYLDAVQQAKRDYSLRESRDLCLWHLDISSESSTLDSVTTIGDNESCASEWRGVWTGPDLRTNVYLPVPDEEFELKGPRGNGHLINSSRDNALITAATTHTHTHTDLNI